MAKLTTPLLPITVASIYNNGPLPPRMAKCTPDTAAALRGVVADLRSLGFDLRLSDLFRSYDMQTKAHEDYVQGRKKAFSPPPGGSMHEAGRAMDVDLGSIDAPNASCSEAWHFDCRGSHDLVYQYVKSGKAGHSMAPYTQMAQSAILAIGIQVDQVPDQDIAYQQAALIRLGFDPGASTESWATEPAEPYATLERTRVIPSVCSARN
jgi:hypothetical protein